MSNRKTPVVDLTRSAFPSSPPPESRPPSPAAPTATAGPSRRNRRQSSIASIPPDDFRGPKRRRHNSNTITTAPASSSNPPRAPRSGRPHPAHAPVTARPRVVEPVDLTEVDDSSPLSRTLAKQREDAVKAQTGESSSESGRSILTNYKCPVCMDIPVDATSTSCGHLFCHKCIVDTLRFGEEQRALDNNTATAKVARGNCPVCRQSLTRRDVSGPRRHLVPLKLRMMRRATRTQGSDP